MVKFLAILAVVGVAIAEPIPNGMARSGFPEGRIIGGEDTTIEEVPYQVSISVQGQHYCGGSIVDENWILTAGHCATLPAKYYTIRAGSSHSDYGGSLHKVSTVTYHRRYTTDAYGVPTNDIALFRLVTPIVMDKSRQPIDLYRKGEESRSGSYAVITGWGTISPNNQVEPHILQTVSVPMITKAECRKAYQSFTIVNPGQICAAYPKGGKDACQGDSGGPLVINGRLAGIVSWGNGCARPGNPGVYTEVAYFREWITDVMGA